MGKKGNSSKDDPRRNNPGDRVHRIEKLKAKLQEITGGEAEFGMGPDCDPELEEDFLKQVLAFETGKELCPYDELVSDGFELPPAKDLDEPTLKKKLWEIIGALGERHMYLERTNHLSDREVYVWLRDDVLRGTYVGFGELDGYWHIDVLGGCSEDDLILAMRYYSTERERKRWAADFPDFPMPRKEKPRYDRDRRLPKPELPF